MIKLSQVKRRSNPFMAPAIPSLVRPNPRRRLPNPFGRVSFGGPLLGGALTVGTNMLATKVLGAKWVSWTSLGIGLFSCLVRPSAFVAGLAGAQFYMPVSYLFHRVIGPKIDPAVAAAVAAGGK
jgi:hypothetical protein